MAFHSTDPTTGEAWRTFEEASADDAELALGHAGRRAPVGRDADRRARRISAPSPRACAPRRPSTRC
jgi:acyl-CoA reductase-like NAD-dependent aldehyde dehydrogenase